jgi:hypothetical protein
VYLCVPCGKELSLPISSVNHALDAVLQAGNVKIDEQADVLPAEAQVRKQLCFMDGMDCLHTLDLYNHQILNQQVDTLSEVEFFALVDDRQAYLRFHHETSLPEFLGQTSLVGTLQQTSPKQRMNSHRGINDCAGYLIYAGCGDDCTAGHGFSWLDHYQPRTVSSVIADCLLGDAYVKIFNHREHR